MRLPNGASRDRDEYHHRDRLPAPASRSPRAQPSPRATRRPISPPPTTPTRAAPAAPSPASSRAACVSSNTTSTWATTRRSTTTRSATARPATEVDHTPPNPIFQQPGRLAAGGGHLVGPEPGPRADRPRASTPRTTSPARARRRTAILRPSTPSCSNTSATRLYTAAELGTAAWPDWTSSLTNKIVVILSGDETNRRAATVRPGQHPGGGDQRRRPGDRGLRQSTQSSRLWYWCGNAAGGGVDRAGRPTANTTTAPPRRWPSTTAGVIVEVHKSQNNERRSGATSANLPERPGAVGRQPDAGRQRHAALGRLHRDQPRSPRSMLGSSGGNQSGHRHGQPLVSLDHPVDGAAVPTAPAPLPDHHLDRRRRTR